MAVFDGLQPKREGMGLQQTPAQKLARQLGNWLVKKREIIPPKYRKWQQDFAALLREASEEQIEQTLAWYIAEQGPRNLPLCRTAKAFCAQYGRWKREMANDPRRIVLGQWPAWVYERWQRKGWPAGLDIFLPLIIQRSWENYGRFLAQIEVVAAKLEREQGRSKKAGRLLKMLQYFDKVHFFSPRDFVDAWVGRLHENLRRIPAWNGTVVGLVFTVHGERFTRLGMQWAAEYCEDAAKWHELMAYFTGA